MANGVNNDLLGSEWVALKFNLLLGTDFGDVLDALGDGSLRMGLHVQNIDPDGDSDSYVNKVPEPGILILLGIAMTAVGVASRYARKI